MSKHLVLTGGAGFIGHHTVEHILKNTDWNITIIDRLTYAGNLNRLTDLDCWIAERGRVKFVYHDFRAPLITGRIITGGFGQVDYFIHMGAESHVDRSIADAIPFAESNVVGTVHMLNLGRALAVERFILVSTDEVYGASIGGHLHAEGEPHRPGNPYSASKAGAEDFALAYANTYGMPVIITNTMNNFGERQDIEKFVPKVIRSIYQHRAVIAHVKKIENKTVDISSRCWLHARNHADALLFLLDKGVNGERYNIVGDKHDVIEMIYKINGYMDKPYFELVEEDFHSFRKGHDMHYGLDGTKLSSLGWKPKFTLEKSLEQTVRWSLDHKEWLEL